MAASPKDPPIYIKNDWNDRKGKTPCNLDLAIFCYPHAFWNKGAGNLHKTLQEEDSWLQFNILE